MVALSIDTIIRSQRLSIFLNHIRIEELALKRVIASKDGNLPRPQTAQLILRILSLGTVGTEKRVIRTGVEVRSDASTWVIMRLRAITAAFLWWLLARARSRRSIIRLLITIQSSDNDLELTPVLFVVGSGSGVDDGAPERAFVVCD